MRQLKKNIIAMARKRGLSIRSLETKAGLNRTFISNFLYDRSKNPGVDSIIKIADALGVTVDELVGKELEHKTYDLNITKKDIFLEVAYYLLKTVETKHTNNLNLKEFFDAIYEIYNLSLKEGKFDKELANWFIKSQI